MVGPAVHHLVVQAFETGSFPLVINETLMVLILKVDAPTSINQFHPISLCNVIYKIITKVLVQLKQFMPRLIHPLHASFVPGRQATDNIIVAQEILHSLQRSKSLSRGMFVKIDLEKAYDKVNWQFLFQALHLLHFSPSIVNLIATCVTSTNIYVLWNGHQSAKFKPTLGLHQGDPLSPFLFVLYLERLSSMIDKAVTDHKWRPCMVCRGGPFILHLLFADNLLLFSRATMNQATIVMDVLSLFSSQAGQSVSASKSVIFFSPRVLHAVQLQICRIASMRATTDLGKYLGISLLFMRPSKHTY